MANIAAVVRSIQHYLDHKLEGFSNGAVYPPSSPANKTNGYVAAKVPDWQLRQWIRDLAATEVSEGAVGFRAITPTGSAHAAVLEDLARRIDDE